MGEGRTLAWGARYVVWTAALLVAAMVSFLPARAATVIYHSAPENTYGWCAGYGYDRAHSCAKGYCRDAGGAECDLAVECAGGWGAVALAQDPARGFGASCGYGDASSARRAALAVCAAKSGTLCWTDSTFDRNASQLSAASNRNFDTTWYAQGVLQIRHFDPGTADGELGPMTRAALGEFQMKLGRPATGVLDDELFDRLLDAGDGPENLAKIIARDVYEKKADQLVDNTYGRSSSPAPDRTFSAELLERTPEARLMALATRLASGGTECSLPAVDAELVSDPDAGFWSIECQEATYTLVLSEGSTIIMRSGPGAIERGATPQADTGPATVDPGRKSAGRKK